MTERRRGLGRGLGALIPTGSLERPAGERPVDVFFPEREQGFTGNTGIDRDEQPPAQAGGADAPDRDSDSRPEIQHEHVEQAGAGSDEGAHQVPVPGHDAPVGPGTGHGSAVSRPETDDGFAVGRREMGDGSPGVAGPALSTRDLEAPPGETPSSDAVGAGQRTTGLLPVPGAQFAEIPVACIVPNPRQPRQVFDEESMAELVHSIREIGVLQPVVVRQVGTDAVSDAAGLAPSYELVTGERRWRACERAGLTHVPAIVRETSDDALLRDALLENLHRSDLNPLEEAAAYQQLLDDFGCTHDELAERLGRSRPQVSNTIRLLKLPPLVQRRVAAGVLTAGHARALLGMSDAGAMERLAQRIVAEGLSVRSTEEIVALGDDVSEGPRRRSPRQGERHAALDDLATRLSDRLDTRVKIALGQRKGRLTVEFASVDDLNRILGVLVPEGERVL